jgi:hypothetical protein
MPEQVNLIARIEYLVRRRFPHVDKLRTFPSSLGRGRGPPPADTTELRKAVDAYRSELLGLTLDELVARQGEEQAKEREEWQQRLEREERERFFNLPQAKADYDHWSKAAHWTLDEAIALSFGRAPEIVRWDKLANIASLGSPFVTQYARRRDLALRAMHWKQLFDPVLPGIFLAWAKRTDIAVPRELVEAVEKRGVRVADWKTLYDDAMALREREAEVAESRIADWKQLHDKAVAQMAKDHSEWLEITAGKNARIEDLEARIAVLAQAQAEPSGPRPEEIGARSRDSLLKLVIGMAVAGYVYDPKATRSDKPTEIAGDLERAGVPLDVDTVRKWLREAAELLPPK